MKTNPEYQPEDIEALLAEKPFRELLDEEKAFVLQHLASPDEYEHMRETLLAIKGASGADDSEKELPSPRVREELVELFRRERKKRIIIWWNTLGYWLRDLLRLDLPFMRIAVAAVVLLIGVWTVIQFTGEEEKMPEPKQLAQNNPPAKTNEKKYEVPGTTLTKAQLEKDSSVAGSMSVVSGGTNNVGNAEPNPKLAANQAIVNFTEQDSVKKTNNIASSNVIAKNLDSTQPATNISGVAVNLNYSNAIHQDSSSPATYAWTPNFSNTYSNTNANGIHPGNYTVTATDANAANANPVINLNVPKSKSLAKDSTAIKLFFKVE